MSIDIEKKEVRVNWRYPYSREKVFKAIAAGRLLMTCGGRMHEFKHDFRIGGKFAFSWAPGKICRGTYLEIVSNERLKWTWDENSKSEPISEVTVVLSTKGNFTHIDLLHEKAGSVDSAHDYHQGWTEVLGLFLNELTGTTMRMFHDFNVSAAQLFKALSMGGLFRGVSSSENFKIGTFDFREGGSYDYSIGEKDYARGQIQRIIPNEIIRFSWSTLDCGQEVRETDVLLFLEVLEPNKTRLHLVHDGLPTEEVSDSHAQGWKSALKTLNENIFA